MHAFGASPENRVTPCTMYFVQPVLNMWNVFIAKTRHEQQVFSTMSLERLHVHSSMGVRDVELVVVVIFMCRYMDSWSKQSNRAWSHIVDVKLQM
jgi:hypothetical protein